MSCISPMWLQSIFIPSEFCNLCACQHRSIYHRHYPDSFLSPKYNIFVSFNKAQGEFVEQLCMDLERHNRFAWFDKPSSNLRGDPPEIAECEMVVVVVSEEYFTSSMLELRKFHKIMEASMINKKLKILPLFFGLNVHEVYNRQEEWFKVWKKMLPMYWYHLLNLDECKQSLKLILGFNGLVYNRDSKLEGLVAYRKEIVSKICKVVPPTMSRLDELRFQERSKLCKVTLLMVFPKVPMLVIVRFASRVNVHVNFRIEL